MRPVVGDPSVAPDPLSFVGFDEETDRRAHVNIRGAIGPGLVDAAVVAAGRILIAAPEKRLIIPNRTIAARGRDTDGLDGGGGLRQRRGEGDDENTQPPAERLKTHADTPESA